VRGKIVDKRFECSYFFSALCFGEGRQKGLDTGCFDARDKMKRCILSVAVLMFPVFVWAQEAMPQAQGEADAKIRQLRERVEDLKAKVFDAKSRLAMLRERILYDLVADARVIIVHRNDVSSFFVLDEALYFFDDQQVFYQRNRDGSLESQKKITIFEGPVKPGSHVVSVELLYRGNGKVFKYLEGYKFRVKSSFNFYASKGYRTEVTVVGFEKGGLTTPMEERPSVKFEMTRTQVAARASEEQPASK
jgi:hypothetical protein